jgi:DNA-binding beta-propeller fold protein YncE
LALATLTTGASHDTTFARDGVRRRPARHHVVRDGGVHDRDTTHLNRPANMVIDPQTNELFVADGYGNHRLIVFDGQTAPTGVTGAPTAVRPATPA